MSAAKTAMKRQLDIIDAARGLVVNGGAESITMTKLAEAAGLKRTAAYQYFSSKEEVLGELVLNEMGDMAQRLESLVSRVDDPSEKVRVWVHYCLTYLSDDQHIAIQSIAPERIAPSYSSLIKTFHGLFMAPLVSALEELSCASPESLSHMIYGAVHEAAKRIHSGANFTTEAHVLETFSLGFLEQ